MKVQEIILKDNRKRYLLVDDSGIPLPEAATYLKLLDNIGKSVNTQKTYCYALKKYFEFLEEQDVLYTDITIKTLADFMGWLRFPHYNQAVSVLNPLSPLCCEKTANLILSVVCGFYDYLYRNNKLERYLGDSLVRSVVSGSPRKYKDFLYHISKDKPVIQNYLKMKEPVKKIQILSRQQVESIYFAATNIRDRFLIRLLYETGMRIGEALSLFVEDFIYGISAGHRIRLAFRRELINGARLKSGERTIHISQDLMNLFDDYMYQVLDRLEFDSNFVFVKLKGKNAGNPMTYSDVGALFKVLRSKTGINVYPHLLRHTHATLFYVQTKDIKQVQERLGHAQIQTTMNLYLHPSEDEVRRTWDNAQALFHVMEDR